jgi:hypothetical protein
MQISLRYESLPQSLHWSALQIKLLAGTSDCMYTSVVSQLCVKGAKSSMKPSYLSCTWLGDLSILLVIVFFYQLIAPQE